MHENCVLAFVMVVITSEQFGQLQSLADEYTFCLKSIETMKTVDRCPRSEKEMIDQAKRKNCEQYAVKQNCTVPKKFKYHCVINSFRNATIEVCAAERRIPGFCTEFNKKVGIIQAHLSLVCVRFNPPCPKRYNSSRAYLYTGCYNSNSWLNGGINLIGRPKPGPTIVPIMNYTVPENRSSNIAYGKEETPKINVLNVLIGCTCGAIVGMIFNIFVHVVKKIRKKRSMERRKLDLDITEIDSHIAQEEYSDIEEETSLFPQNTLKGQTITLHVKTETVTSTDRYSFAMLKTMEDLSEENIEETKRYLKKYKVIDKYFVETQMYDKAKSCLEKHGILIMTGPPGCGKTNAAIHLMLGLSDQDWTCRKIHALEEFSFIEKDEKSLVFIDDLFHHSLLDYDIESWWDKLEYYFSKQILCSGKNNQQKLNLIITARENVINRVCLFMNRVAPLFQESFRVDFNSLTDDEKLDIFSKQTEFSSREKNISFPIVNEEFRSKIKKAEGPIGFPLCAHLYACKQEYRTRGVKFFSHPIEFLKIQIRDEIESDKSSRTKTLFFVLFLFEWHSTQLQKIGRSAKIHIERESHCRQILNDISKDLIDNFIPLDFTELANVAQRLQGSFFLVETEGNYKFVHDSIHDAVGAYFCETYFTETAMYFPLDIIKDQEYYNLSEASMELLAQRLIYDALCNRLSEVFSCRIFRNKTFVDIFCRELKKKKLITINRFFTLKNESSNVSLPCLFWVSHNSLTYASESLYEVTKENYVNTDYQFYLHLYGECCSRNKNLLTTVNGMLRNNFEEIKKEVFNFRDADKNSILHLLVLSERSDESVSAAVEKLLDDGLNVDSRNGRSITPLMFAVEQTLSRKHVIKTLISHGAKQKLSDSERSTVYHHCLRSDNDDKTCAEYLQLLLPKLEEKKEILSKGDSRGETALNTAAKQMHCSRICSILSLLQYEECIVGTLNEEGFSPIHNVVEHLKGISTFVKLECCIRVIIFLRYGIDPQKLSDKNFRAVDLSKDDVVNRILKNPKDISVMKNSLDDLLKNMEPKHCKLDILPDLNEKLGIEIQSRIEKAVPYLLNVIFEK